MKTIRLLSVIVLALSMLPAQAQDAHFSQFYAAPVQMNPAMTGVFPGQFRVAANYRNQWSSILQRAAFNTYAASFDMRYNVLNDDYLAFGVSMLRDDAGDARFNQTQANLSVSFMKQLTGGRGSYSTQYLVAGLQAGIAQNGLDWSKLSFSTQFDDDAEEYIPGNPTGEDFGNDSRVYANVNAGLLWYAVFDDNLSLYVGGALHHVNRPDISFYDGTKEPLYMRWLGQVGGEVAMSNNFSILPAAIFMSQGPSFQTNLGTNIRYSNNDMNEIALRMGGWVRIVKGYESISTDAFIVTTMLEMERFILGLSYDINTSSLTSATNARGAFEISVMYIQPEQRRYKTACPKF